MLNGIFLHNYLRCINSFENNNKINKVNFYINIPETEHIYS